jgi:uncharacterized protein (TIGR02284 family)
MSNTKEFNLDPITKEPGAHPVGAGLGAAIGGAAAGAAAGALAGPAGALVGAVAGAVAGGLGGKAAAESVNPTADAAYWASAYSQEPYYEAGRSFDDYAPAYRLGAYARTEYPGSFDAAESRLETHWEAQKDRSLLSWQQARSATFAAWQRAGAPTEPPRVLLAEQGDDTKELVYGDVFDTLNHLLEACRDGEYGFRECAGYSKADNLTELLNRYAEETQANAAELQALVRELGGKAEESGSVMGALHRGWVSVRGTLTGYSALSMLDECERGQDTLLAAYTKARKQNLPENAMEVLARQAVGVQHNHDRIKELRDTLKASD